MNLVENTQRLLNEGLVPAVFLEKWRNEISRYHDEIGYPNVTPPRTSSNPEKERGISTVNFDFVRFYFQWSIQIEDWADLQPLFIDFIREYLASPELDPRKMASYDPLLKRSGQRIHELAMSGRYPEEEVRFQWFGGGN